MANTSSEKELKTFWPITSGLTAGTTKQEGRQSNLIPTIGSLVPRRLKVGL
jgi:hypothetical protein|tara:strand:- start:223 stop:375 length:153 start_codon:yes stop_codon:yes gene_type:complete